MVRMPNQTPLPFPEGPPGPGPDDPQRPAASGAGVEAPPGPGAPASVEAGDREATGSPETVAADAPATADTIDADGPATAEPGVEPDPDAAALPHDPAQSELAMPALPREPLARPRPNAARRPWWARLLGQLMKPWVSLTIEPEQPAQHDDGRPVCYVLEDYGLSNALILERACFEAGLPSPLQPLPGDPLGRKRAYVALSRRNTGGALAPLSPLNPGPPSAKTHSGSLARLLDAHREDPVLDVQLVPVSIFVGRAPDKTSGWFSVLFSENWALVGRFRRLLAILLNGRNTVVRFAPPVSLRGVIDEGLPPERTVR